MFSWLEHDYWHASYCIHWWIFTLYLASPLSHLARGDVHLMLCIRFIPRSCLLLLSRKFLLAAPCGNHHRRQRWEGFSWERALNAVVAMETTFTHVLLVAHLTDFERFAGLIDRFRNTQKLTHTHKDSPWQWLSWLSSCFYNQPTNYVLFSVHATACSFR